MARPKGRKNNRTLNTAENVAIKKVFELAEKGDAGLKLAVALIKYRSLERSIEKTAKELAESKQATLAAKQYMESYKEVRAGFDTLLKEYEAEIEELIKELN